VTAATAGVATSDPRATDTAAAVIDAGGNAVDAAVSAAFVLFVVEPHYCGVAGDAFVIVGGEQSPVAYDGSGALPAALTSERLQEDGLDGVPALGGRTATVPGALGLLETVLARRGTMSLSDTIAPAVALARDGFQVRRSLARAAAKAASEIGSDPVLGLLYVPDGAPVEEGALVRNPALADCLSLVGSDGAAALYRGPLGRALVDTVQADHGYLTVEDLAAYETMPMPLERRGLRGCAVHELPAPTQGPAVLNALAALDGTPALEGGIDWMTVVEATRTGMARAGFDVATMGPRSPSPAKGDTTYLAVIDHQGLAVSLITSVFGDFGSHLGVPALGGPVHNRATTLRMLHREPAPGKPPHTTIPALITDRTGAPAICLGVAGGIMQPQTQVQVLIRVLCQGLGLQEAIDAPRFKLCFGGDLALEPGHPLSRQRPEALARDPGPEGFGNAQAVGWRSGSLEAAADDRRGGSARLLIR
jgi:gamma-glutamyltranspeptidase/glutathione hydrolase